MEEVNVSKEEVSQLVMTLISLGMDNGELEFKLAKERKKNKMLMLVSIPGFIALGKAAYDFVKPLLTKETTTVE